ncbi:MAG: glycoside hydrolase TIM-barrel-like domain-containing protein, partial [Parvibaculum sp.]|nr:glycoside hydrolase TIM-barrel-like domain-containing protein [Parvibaculum sp.]
RIAGGENFDWYYASEVDRASQLRTPIADGAYGKPWVWRAKDIKSWWSNAHHNRPGGIEAEAPTAWLPQSKPIWFTELGCPAIDKGTNQPNVFVDPKSAESALPHFSRGTRDDFIQRRFIEAQMSYWNPAHADHVAGANPVSAVYGGPMVDPARIFLWTWDARPFPAFPERIDIWTDGENWQRGHWLNGRMGAAPLADLAAAVMREAGFEEFDVGELGGTVEGFVIDRIISPRAALEPLMLAHFFDAAETQGVIRFRHFGDVPVARLTPDELAVDDDGAAPGYALTRGQETELPNAAKIAYIDGGGEYRQAAVEARRLAGRSARVTTATLPMVLTQPAAQAIADIWMQKAWSERERAALALPPSRLALDAGDVVTLELPHREARFRLTEIADTHVRSCRGVGTEESLYGPVTAPVRSSSPAAAPSYGTPLAVFMDLPLLTGEETPHAPRIAVAADPWPGGIAVFKSAGAGFAFDRVVTRPATLGFTMTPLMPGPVGRWDEANELTIALSSGELASADMLSVLAGANAAALETQDGDWEIIQFRAALLVAPNEVLLSGLLRGQAGSESAMRAPLAPGARFVLLDEAVNELGMSDAERGLARTWAYGPAPLPLDDETYVSIERIFDGIGLRPVSPVHLHARRGPGGDIELGWIRRTRIGGDSWAGLDVPLGEESEAYEIDIHDGEAVKRVIAATEPRAVYSAADQIADFGSTGFPALEVTVCQLSASFGRGAGRRATLTV